MYVRSANAAPPSPGGQNTPRNWADSPFMRMASPQPHGPRRAQHGAAQHGDGHTVQLPTDPDICFTAFGATAPQLASPQASPSEAASPPLFESTVVSPFESAQAFYTGPAMMMPPGASCHCSVMTSQHEFFVLVFAAVLVRCVRCGVHACESMLQSPERHNGGRRSGGKGPPPPPRLHTPVTIRTSMTQSE